MRQQEKFYHENEYLMEFKELDEEFHNYIIMSVENNAILPLINDHLLHISRWRNVYIKSGYKLSKLIDEHKSILEAIKANDTERALRCMTNHIDTVSGIASLDPEYISYFKGADHLKRVVGIILKKYLQGLKNMIKYCQCLVYK